MADFPGIFRMIQGDIHLFWLLLGLALISMYSLMDEHDSLSYVPPQQLRHPYVPYSGQVPVEEVYEQPRVGINGGIGIGGTLSSHSGQVVPREYTSTRNYLTGTGL